MYWLVHFEGAASVVCCVAYMLVMARFLGHTERHFEVVGGTLTPYEFWTKIVEPGKPAELFRALMRGVMLSALLAMNSMGWLVLPSNGPEIE